MAIFTSSSLIGGISGSIGGATFVNARGSKVVRHRPARRTLRGPGHRRSMSAMNQVQNAWTALTDAQRLMWATSATASSTTNRLGQSSPPTGHQLFSSVNLEMITLSIPQFDEPNIVGRSEGPTTISFDLTVSGDFIFTAQPPHGSGTGQWWCFAYALWLPTPPTFMRRPVFLAFDSGPSMDLDVRTEFEALYGPPQLGQLIVCGIAARSGTRYRSRILTELVTVAA